MVDLNPISAWRRFLARPNDSRTKTVVIAFLVSAGCALMVSGATVILRPIQAANRAAEQQARLEALIAGIPGMSELLSEAGGTLSTVVINLKTGRAAKEVTPQTLPTALEDPANWTTLPAEQDIAGLTRRPDFAQIFLLRDANEQISVAVLPIAGSGFQGPIDAILAMQGDMTTIAGLSITNQVETPGLGGRIVEPQFLRRFPGVKVSDEAGRVRVAVVRGAAGNEFEVEGITGATRTSNAMSQILKFWVGPAGYGQFFDSVKAGEF